MRTWKLYIALAIVAASAGIFATAALAQPTTNWLTIGQTYRSGIVSTDVVASVDGLPVTRGELAITRALVEMSNAQSTTQAPTDDRALLERLIQTKSMVAEATRRGFQATPVETAALIQQVRRDFHRSSKTEAQLADFLKGIGMDEATWFASDFAKTWYAQNIAIGKLQAQVLQGVATSDRAAAWDRFQRAVRASARVEILDPSLK